MITLVLGGARSGKSAYAQAAAEREAAATGADLTMIVTAQAFDAEMAARIAAHQNQRGEAWRTVEAPLALADAIADLAPHAVVVVDCLTLWLSNQLLADADLTAASAGLLQALAAARADIWLVSNEVGMGIVPDNALARRFRDEAGLLHSRIAAMADEVMMIIAGLPMKLK